jgi:hypothetical protein
MDTTRKQLALVSRGDLIQTAEGFVIADTWASDFSIKKIGNVRSGDLTDDDVNGVTVQFWYDTDSGKHYGTDGLLTVASPGFRTRDYGNSGGNTGHALLNAVPSQRPQGLCPASRNADLTIWSSGTALSAVDCEVCRKMIGLVAGIKR